jgi:ABC-type antimicrobial peptide transport system permease subunit
MNLVMQSIQTVDDNSISDIDSMASVNYLFPGVLDRDSGGVYSTWVLFDGHEDTLIWDEQAFPGSDIGKMSEDWSQGAYTVGDGARDSLDRPATGSSLNISIASLVFDEFGIPSVESSSTTVTVNYAGMTEWIPGFSAAESSNSIIIGESTFMGLLGNPTSYTHASDRWFFELCDEGDDGCKDALEAVSADLRSKGSVISAQDWSSAHENNERNGGLVFGTPGLLSMMFVVAALASVSSAFVFLSLVLSQRKKELAILQAIGASPNQVVRLVLFEIMSILLVSMVLGVTLGLAVSESFNGFFSVFGFIFQLFLGQSAPIDRDLIWPWFELVLVNGLVLAAVVISLLFTTRRALDSDLATVLKGE